MNILVVEAEPSSADDAIDALQRAGHRVDTCYERGGVPVCVALEGACPLDVQAIDVVLTVRRAAHREPVWREGGVACGIRHRLPLVVAGEAPLHPYEAWTVVETAAIDGEAVVAACEVAAQTALSGHTACVLDEARNVCDRHATGDPILGAEVRRHDNGLAVDLVIEGGGALPFLSMLPARIVGALRAYDPYVKKIDVTIVEGERSNAGTSVPK